MLSPAIARARVQAGARYLDRLWAEWYRHVDVNQLDMSIRCDCVLGQLDGDFYRAARRLWPQRAVVRIALNLFGRRDRADLAAVAYGFDVPDSSLEAERVADFALLQDAWVGEIAERIARDDAQGESGLAALGPGVIVST